MLLIMKRIARLGVMLVGIGTSLQALPDQGREYEITVINLTHGQSFTPILAATATDGVSLFTVTKEASPEFATLAEGR